MLSTKVKRLVNRIRGQMFRLHRHSRLWLPGVCLVCAQPISSERDLCTACTTQLPQNHHCCSHCAEPLPDLLQEQSNPCRLCSRCRKNPPAFDAVLAPWLYATPVDQLLWRFKYQQQRTAGYLLLDLLGDTLQSTPLAMDALVVIPGQRERIRARGLHAPTWLAQRLALMTGLTFQPNWLQSTRSLTSQQELGRKARWLNPKGAFKATAEVEGKRLLLLDDVVTTGATAHWASVALKQQGAQEVVILAAARTPA